MEEQAPNSHCGFYDGGKIYFSIDVHEDSTSTDTKMTDHYNKRPKPQSPPTTPNNVSALVPVAKKNKNVKFKRVKSGPSNSKAAQGRS